MWCDYKQANPSPTQQDIAQWVWNTFGAQGAIDSNGDGIVDYLDRAIWPIEYGDVLNHFIPATKYHRWFLPSADDMIGREVHLIAEYHEPSAAVCEMELPGQPNNPADSMWHWLLVVGCAADGWPGTGGVNVFGLWIQDPGGWFTPTPAYVSSDIWKQKYFEVYTDRDGASGYMHAEDPPPGDNRMNHLRPIRCEPPTKPHGMPVSLQYVQQIAQEGIGLHLLNFTGHLAPYFQKARPGTPVLVRAMSPKFGDYYVVPYLRDSKVTAMVIVDAARGQFHGATACTAGWSNFPSLPSEAAGNLVLLQRQVNVRRMELVWGFCKEALSPYTPIWRVESETGGVFYVSQRGTIHQTLTRHSCIGGGK